MNSIESSNNISLESHEIAEIFANEAARSTKYANYLKLDPAAPADPAKPEGPTIVQHLTLNQYKSACKEFLHGEEALSEKHWKEKLRSIRQNSNLKIDFPAGWSCHLAVLPFSNNARELTDENIEQGKHLRFLIIKPNGLTRGGVFSPYPSFVSRLFPLEIQGCATFQIPQYQEEGEDKITTTDRKAIADRMFIAFNNLRAILG